MSFDPLPIEYAFARITGNEIGKRGKGYDSDFFQGGNVKEIAKGMLLAIKSLKTRVNALKFTKADEKNGGIRARLNVAIERLEGRASAMAKLKVREPQDYHWQIVGDLISTIDALLELAAR